MIQICGNRDPAQEAEVLHWIGQVLGAKLPEDKAYSTRSFFFWSTVINTIFEYSDIRFEDVLKDGVVLCHLMNKISPGSIKKVQERGTNFQLMENIQRYSKWCVCGVAKGRSFQMKIVSTIFNKWATLVKIIDMVSLYDDSFFMLLTVSYRQGTGRKWQITLTMPLILSIKQTLTLMM